MRLLPGAGSPISLRALLPGAAIQGADDIIVEACVAEVGKVRPGTLFAAMSRGRGPEAAAIAEAVKRGCRAVLTDQPLSAIGVPVCRVSDTRLAYARLCHALAGDPGRKLKVVAVGGSWGKRSTACLVAGVLHAAGYRLGMLGSLGCLDGHEVSPLAEFPSSPDKTAMLLARMVASGCSHAILEAPSNAVLDGRLAGIPLDILVLTWVENGPEPQGARRRPVASGDAALTKLLDQLAPEGLGVLNAEDPLLATRLGDIDGPVLTVGLNSPAEIRGVDVDQDAGGQTFLLVAGSDIIPVSVRTPGRAHRIHCLLAAAVGLAYQIDLPVVVRGLESVDYVPVRLERVDSGWPLPVFVDGAQSAGALTACLEALRDAVPGQIICVVGIDHRADRGESQRLIEAACQSADTVIVTSGPVDASPGHRRGRPGSSSAEVQFGQGKTTAARRWVRRLGPRLAEISALGVPVVPERFEAFSAAVARARPGDAVLVLGDDGQEVRAWLSRVSLPDENYWTNACSTRGSL